MSCSRCLWLISRRVCTTDFNWYQSISKSSILYEFRSILWRVIYLSVVILKSLVSGFFFVLVRNLHGKDGGFADLYHIFIFFIFFIVIDARIRPEEEGIRITNVPARSKQILNGGREVVVGLKRVRVWQVLLLWCDENGAKDDQILVRVAAPDLLHVEFTFKTRKVHQSDGRYNCGPENDSRI